MTTPLRPFPQLPRPARIGLVGDFHGPTKRPALELFVRQANPDVLLAVGDLQDYAPWPRPTLFVRGNHEDWAAIRALAAGTLTPANLYYLPDRTIVTVAGLRVAGVGGVEHDPYRGILRDLDPASVEWLADQVLDIVISHETPARLSGRKAELTRDHLRLAAQVSGPRYWLSGHHHQFELEELPPRTRLVSLGRWPHEWATLELAADGALAFARFAPTDPAAYQVLLRRWQAAAAADREGLNRET